jgi:hypothetical protein
MIERRRKVGGVPSAASLGASPAEQMTGDFLLREAVAKQNSEWYSARQAMLDKNPASYGISEREPAITAAMAKAANARTPADRASTFNDYANAQLAFQKRIGVPGDKRHVLSEKTALAQSKDIMESADPKKGIDEMKAIYGDRFPQIFKDVVSLGKLPSKFESLVHLDAQNADVLSGMIKAESEAKPNEHRRMMEGLMGADRAVVVKAVRTGAADLMDSMIARRMTDPEQKEKLDTITMLAEGRMRKFHETAAVASDEAVKAFTKDYKFVDKIAIPVSKYQGVMAERKDRVRFLSPDNIVVPDSVSNDVHDKKGYVTAVQTGGSWVSTKEGDGMYLVDHWGNPVMTMSPSATAYDDASGTERVIPGKPTPVKIMYDKTYGSLSSRSELSRFNWFTAGVSD